MSTSRDRGTASVEIGLLTAAIAAAVAGALAVAGGSIDALLAQLAATFDRFT